MTADGKDNRQEEIAAIIGANLRFLRLAKGMSQARLGETLGMSFQQVQKYETGRNRISAPVLHLLSETLDAPVSAFFAGVTPGTTALAAQASNGTGRTQAYKIEREFFEIYRLYRKLPPEMRKRVKALLAGMDDGNL